MLRSFKETKIEDEDADEESEEANVHSDEMGVEIWFAKPAIRKRARSNEGADRTAACP